MCGRGCVRRLAGDEGRGIDRAGARFGAAHDLVAAGEHDRHDHGGEVRRHFQRVQRRLHVAGERVEVRIVHALADGGGVRALEVHLAESVRAAADQREILAHAALQPVHVDAVEQVLDAQVAHDAGEHDLDHCIDRAHAADLFVDRLRRGFRRHGFCLRLGFRGRRRLRRSSNRSRAAFGDVIEALDQRGVVALGLAAVGLEIAHDRPDAVEALEHGGDGFGAGDQLAVAQLAEDVLAGVSHRFEARQAEEAAGALHRVDQTEDVSEQLHVVRVAFELDQLDVEDSKVLGGFRQELTQQIIHVQALGLVG